MLDDLISVAGKHCLYFKLKLKLAAIYMRTLSFGTIQKPAIMDKLLKALALQIGSEVSYIELNQILEPTKKQLSATFIFLKKPL